MTIAEAINEDFWTLPMTAGVAAELNANGREDVWEEEEEEPVAEELDEVVVLLVGRTVAAVAEAEEEEEEVELLVELLTGFLLWNC